MSDVHDHSVLKWIKPELDASVELARHALEAYIDGTDPEAELDSCIDHLHQVRGTLQLMQLYGAAMLAEEMESVARVLGGLGSQKRKESAGVLMVGLAQLPDYLENIETGSVDNPLLLLPLMNELRAARDASLLSELALFAPDLDQKLQAADDEADANVRLPKIARKLRYQYHKALLDWYRDIDSAGGLQRLGELFLELEEGAGTRQVRQLFQVARAIAAALADKSIASGIATKLLLGKVDREIKRIIDQGEGAVARAPANDLIKNLLYYAARADSTAAVVQQTKRDFNLDTTLLGQTGLNDALHAPGRELLDSLRTAISTDLTAIKDQLDLFIRSNSQDLSRLQALRGPVKKLADTLGMVGQGELRSRLIRQADRLGEIVAAERYPDEQDLMAMAGDILFVETSLNNLSVVRRYAAQQMDQPVPGLPSGEFERLVDSVMHEAGIDMSRNKEAIIHFIETPDDKSLLSEVPRRFSEIAGAFKVLTLNDAAQLMGRLNRYVTESLLGDQDIPSSTDLDAFADAVTGIEYFMEAVIEGRGIHPEILDVTRQALARLGVPEELQQPRAAALAEVEQSLEDASEVPVDSPVDDESEMSLEDQSGTVETVDIQPEFDIQPETVAASDTANPSVTVNEPPVAALPERTPSVDKPALEDIDPEILEIFVEEAEEELAVIQEFLPRWCDNHDDQEALTTFRRSFHTLKGSGRLVGAKVIGEFAWSIENLLNRVIDETIAVSPALTKLLNDALAVLPELVECQKRGVVPEVDIQPIVSRAEALARPDRPAAPAEHDGDIASEQAEHALDALEQEISDGEGLAFSGEVEFDTVSGSEHDDRLEVAPASLSPTADSEETAPLSEVADEPPSELPEAPVSEEPVEPAPIELDETLLEIFEAESKTHIDTLDQFCVSCSADPRACRVGKELLRALHTLHGSAEMSGVDSMAQVSTALEAMVTTLSGAGQSADQQVLDLIGRSVDQFNRILGAINVPGAELPDWQGLVDDIRNLRRRAEERDAQQGEAVPSDSEVPQSADQEIVLSPSPEAAAGELQSTKPVVPAATTAEVEVSPEAEEDDQPAVTHDSEPDAIAAVESAGEPEPAASPPIGIAGDGERASADTAPATVAALEMVELEGDPELLEIFLEEARELQEALDETLQEGRADLGDKRISEALQRDLHTLKGGARLAGALPIGDLSHAFESLLTAVDQQQIATGQALTELTHEIMDRLADQIDDLGQGPRLRSAHDLVQKMEAWLRQGGADAPQGSPSVESIDTPQIEPIDVRVPEPEPSNIPDEPFAAPAAADETAPVAEAVLDEPPATAPTATPIDRPPQAPASVEGEEEADTLVAEVVSEETPSSLPQTRGQREQVRVRSDLLDRLVNYAGEVSIYRTRIEQQNGQLGFNLTELEQTISRLREQLRQLEIETEAQILFRYEQDRGDDAHDASFDPLELDRFSAMQQVSRSLMETVNDLSNINGFLEDLQSETDTLLLQQSRINTDLQDGLMRTRMVPFSQIVPRLHRVVRQTCNQLQKRAELVIHGGGSEIDRGILERMIGPIEHILRNAIAHGIETPAQRKAAGKRETGQIHFHLSREGSDVQLVISDDGRGVEIPKIREQAIRSGLLDPTAEVSDADVLPFMLEHGFSTAEEVTQISGRGVGMDVVVSEVKQLGGTLDLASQPGQGARFTIRLPLTLAITDALLVELGGEIYAIPHTSIEGVVRVSLAELEACYSGAQERYSYAGQDYLIRYLGSMLNLAPVNLTDQRKWYPLLLVRAGEHRIALQVDGLLGNRQIVVKSVGIQVASVRWISGGTILGDGRVALILDVSALVRSDVAQAAVRKPQLARVEVAEPEPGVGRTVMVVDDSITVRKVTGRLLERHGMNVITAKDGVDAVALLQEQQPDIMLLDIEMPRMDGYELARHMRNSEQLKSIPIIMITSRSGDKHRNLAMELGVKRYLGKPYQESELLENIYSVLNEVSQ